MNEPLMTKSKYCFARNQHNVYEWSVMSTHGMLFRWTRL